MAEVDLHIVGAGPVINRKLQWVYSAAEEEAGRNRKANGEPIQKRRRLEKEAAHVVVDDYILLKRGVLTLLPSSPPASHDQQVRRPLPVSVSISEASSSEVSSSNFDEIEISLYTRKLDDGRCKLKATTGHRDEVRRLLRGAEIGSVDGIARVSCMLSVSPSPEPAWQLEVEVYWRSTVSPFIALNKATKIRTSEEIFSLCVAETTSPQSHRRQDQHAWSPKEFYEHVHVPPKCKADKSSLSVAGLTCQLFPFQTRAVRWLLSREGAAVDVNGRIVQVVDDKPPLVAFREVKTSTGERIMVSDLLNEVVQAPLPATELIKLDGGILAEEMGLGKTVELISLILLNKANRLSTTVRDDYTNTEVRTSGTTLIITPPSILEQWKNELSRHAPELSVMHYTGIKQRKCESEEIVEEFQKADVVLTTYTVLASEIHHAKAVEKRSLRFEQAYRQRLSPLVMLQWWRVCLDEAQMIESGVSAAAVVAQLIPRVNAWAVSGTPIKKDVQDLHGLLMFLRCHPFSNMRIWQRMIDGDSSDLKRLFKQIAMRHSKSIVRDELAIPAQKRIVVTVPFTAIEDSNYSTIFQEMCSDCGLDSAGAPLVEDWDPSSERTVAKMRDWLARLRQTCLHAEIGTRNRRALGRGNAPLRTVDEVLEVLVEQNETSLRSEERSALLARVMQGHLLAFGQDTDGALQLYRSSLTEATEASVECRQQVQDEKERIKKYRSESVKSEAVASDGLSEDEEDEDNNSRLRQYKQRLRHSLEVLHVCAFFTGTAYFQLKEKSGPAEDSPDYQALEREEIKCYDMAKSVRKELLADVTKKTQLLLDKVVAIKKKSFVKFPKVKDDIIIEGIESRKVADNIAILLALLNEQVEKIDSWRSKFTDLLVMKLVDQDEEVEITGDEYESSTKQQDEQYVYLEALRAAIADRQGLLSGQANALIDAEMRGAYKQAVNGAPNEPELKGPAPELFRTILEERMKFIQRKKRNDTVLMLS
jgi:E3 ubiquitin-protein ligase SHPRH